MIAGKGEDALLVKKGGHLRNGSPFSFHRGY